MEEVTYYLKQPQKDKTPSTQKETLVYLFFSYGYFEIDSKGKKKYIRLKYSTGRRIFPYLWNITTQRARSTQKTDYRNLNSYLDNLENLIKGIYHKNRNASPSRLRELLDIELKGGGKDKINLNNYIEKYLDEIKEGTRLTTKGEKYKPGTVKSFKSFQSIFNRFQTKENRKYDFEEITMSFYHSFTGYLTDKNYSPNTIGRHIKQLKIILRAAREEGLHKNIEIDNKAFKTLTKKVENIYLNEDEIKKLYSLDLSDKPNYDLARDVFLVGCYTAQRYSDYSTLNENNIKNGFIELIQKKTQEKVIIPIRPELNAILDKYNNRLPKTYVQKVNDYIKKIGAIAEISEIIQTENTKGGAIVKKDIPKYNLIKTHTARRSGATNMYLAGIPSIDIMKITGHRTESEFLKYIKVTKEETAHNLANHPYFKPAPIEETDNKSTNNT